MIRRALARLAAFLAIFAFAPAVGAAIVSGRVLDPDGNAVRRARVVWEAYRTDEEILVDESRGSTPAPLGETWTDAEGRFRVTLDKPLQRVAIRVLPGVFAGAFFPGPYDSSEDVHLEDVELPSAERVVGRVTEETGKAVSGAKVRVRSGSIFEVDEDARYSEATTGPDGTFSITNAPGRSGTLSVWAPGRVPYSQFATRWTGVETVTLRGGGSISGTVFDPSGKPADSTIVICGLRAAKTDATGSYRLTGISQGTWTVLALGRGDWASQNDAVRVTKGRTTEISLRLVRSASVTGSVIDEATRRALHGVRVSQSVGGFDFRGSQVASRSTRTDAKGKFRITGLAPRRYSIRASKTGYLSATMPGIVAAISPPGAVAIALRKAASVTGRVIDEKGSPVPGTRVQFVAEQGIRAIGRSGRAAFVGRLGVGTTGPDGLFRLLGLEPAKNRTLEAMRVGYVSARRAGITLQAGEVVKDISLVLRRGLEARGRVVDSAGEAIAGAEVWLLPAESGENGGMMIYGEKPDASSGPDGSFLIGGLEPGNYALAVSHEGYARKQVPSVSVRAEALNEWPSVVLTPGVAIAGFVRSRAGEPVAGAQVFSFGEGTMLGNSSTDSRGQFRLDGFGADRAVNLSVRAEGYATLQQAVTPPAENLSLVLKATGKISGRVEDAGTNRPVTDFAASYADPQGNRFGGILSNEAFHSEDGSFEISEVPAGTWKVIVSAAGYRPAEVAGIEIREGERREGVILSLKSGGSVVGRVLEPRRGTGVSNASVCWFEGSDGSQFPGATVVAQEAGDGTAVSTDADGRYRLDGLPTGMITIAAEHPDYLGASRQVEVEDEATVDLTLSLGGSIAGSVLGRNRRSVIPGALVTLEDQGGGFSMGDSTHSDGAGGFLFEHLRAGRYRVSARFSGGSTSWVNVVLAESQRLDGVILETKVGAVVRGTVSGLPSTQLAGINVFASSNSEYQDAVITGDDGLFMLQDVPAGVIELHASVASPSMRSVSKNFEVPEGALEVPVDIVFEGASRLSGRVTRGDKPISDMFISATPDPPSSMAGRSSGRTDESGWYAIEGLSDGIYEIRLGKYRRVFVVSGDTNGDIALPTMSISGVVTESGSNDPIQGANVQVESGEETSTFSLIRSMTDSHGAYLLDNIEPGNYLLTARKQGYRLRTWPMSVATESVEQNLSLERGSGLSIRVVDGVSSIPLRSVYVLAYSIMGSIAFSGHVSLDSEGKGEISSLTPGSYELALFSDGYAPRSFRGVQTPSADLSVGLTPGGRVELRTEAPVSGRLVDGSGATYRISPWRLDGRLDAAPPISSLEHLAPGSYQLIVSGPSGERSYPFSVTELGTTTVEIR